MELPLSDSFKIIERLSGHIPKMGKSAGQELNWAYLLLDTKTSDECIGIFCKPNHITLIDKEIWDKLHEKDNVNITWYLGYNGYITRTIHSSNTNHYNTLHQFITGYFGNGKGQESIDHINQNKLDNRKINLRIVKQGEQNRNRGKVARHSNAKELPKELEGVTLPKFCVYYEDYKKNEKGEKVLLRNFFTIEGHPSQGKKRFATTKSMKITITDKLKEAKDILSILDSGKEYKKVKEDSETSSTTETVDTTPIPILSTPFTPETTPGSTSEPLTEKQPAQWKVTNIYTYLTTEKEHVYRIYLKSCNPEVKDIDSRLDTLITQIKNQNKETSLTLIKTFVEDLRTLRHNSLCKAKSNENRLREDKKIYDSADILQFFKDGRIEDYKSITEASTGDKEDDPKWCKRWNEFVNTLKSESSDQNKKGLISKFLTAQRAKRYRKS